MHFRKPTEVERQLLAAMELAEDSEVCLIEEQILSPGVDEVRTKFGEFNLCETDLPYVVRFGNVRLQSLDCTLMGGDTVTLLCPLQMELNLAKIPTIFQIYGSGDLLLVPLALVINLTEQGQRWVRIFVITYPASRLTYPTSPAQVEFVERMQAESRELERLLKEAPIFDPEELLAGIDRACGIATRVKGQPTPDGNIVWAGLVQLGRAIRLTLDMEMPPADKLIIIDRLKTRLRDWAKTLPDSFWSTMDHLAAIAADDLARDVMASCEEYIDQASQFLMSMDEQEAGNENRNAFAWWRATENCSQVSRFILETKIVIRRDDFASARQVFALITWRGDDERLLNRALDSADRLICEDLSMITGGWHFASRPTWLQKPAKRTTEEHHFWWLTDPRS